MTEILPILIHESTSEIRTTFSLQKFFLSASIGIFGQYSRSIEKSPLFSGFNLLLKSCSAMINSNIPDRKDGLFRKYLNIKIRFDCQGEDRKGVLQSC